MKNALSGAVVPEILVLLSLKREFGDPDPWTAVHEPNLAFKYRKKEKGHPR